MLGIGLLLLLVDQLCLSVFWVWDLNCFVCRFQFADYILVSDVTLVVGPIDVNWFLRVTQYPDPWMEGEMGMRLIAASLGSTHLMR